MKEQALVNKHNCPYMVGPFNLQTGKTFQLLLRRPLALSGDPAQEKSGPTIAELLCF